VLGNPAWSQSLNMVEVQQAAVSLDWMPLIDRRAERRPARRPFAMAVAAGTAVLVAGLTYYGAVQVPSGTRTAPAGSPRALVERGHEVFVANHCQSCHVVAGHGSAVGPELTHIGRRLTADRLAAQIRNPGSVNANTNMPAFDKILDDDLKALVAYLLTLK
jgi:mono/diheme cytochrome c family protein